MRTPPAPGVSGTGWEAPSWSPRGRPACRKPLVLGAAQDQIGGHHAIAQRTPFVVDVAQEQVDRPQALLDSRLDVSPLRSRQNARHAVDRDDLLGHLLLAQHGEGDALVEEAAVHAVLHPGELLCGDPGQRLAEGAAGGPWSAVVMEQLVEETWVELVVGERPRPGGAGTGSTVAGTARGCDGGCVQWLSRLSPDRGSRRRRPGPP